MSEWNDAIEQSAKSLCERATELRDEIRMGKIEGRAAGAIVYDLEICASIIRRLKRPADQDGWKLVPAEPTNEMIRALAGEDSFASQDDAFAWVQSYYDMLAAAPKP